LSKKKNKPSVDEPRPWWACACVTERGMKRANQKRSVLVAVARIGLIIGSSDVTAFVCVYSDNLCSTLLTCLEKWTSLTPIGTEVGWGELFAFKKGPHVAAKSRFYCPDLTFLLMILFGEESVMTPVVTKIIKVNICFFFTLVTSNDQFSLLQP
jgi:hypothetical protein